MPLVLSIAVIDKAKSDNVKNIIMDEGSLSLGLSVKRAKAANTEHEAMELKEDIVITIAVRVDIYSII